ncbi:MAG: hypothetical protein WBP84_11420, partial [Nitrososphaeraceae archaeon]
FAKELKKEYHFLMTCKGICLRHKAIKPADSGRYVLGQKRCQICSIFINWEGFFCPCCGYRLRTRPRYRKYKLKLTQMQSKKSR